jgi:hypothetical protein
MRYPFAAEHLLWIIPLLIWSLIWKGLALWKAARQGQSAWYVVMLIVNTVGILEILYIFVFSKKHVEVIPPKAPETK